MSLDLDKLTELEASATPGPWEAQEGAFGDPADGPDHMRVLREGWCTAYDVEHTVARLEGSQVGAADAALIAAARNALPALIDAARACSGAMIDRTRITAERDAAQEAFRAARAEVAALRGMLAEATAHETEPCRLDHNGNCQEHGYHAGPCLIPRARAALATGADQ